MLFWLVFGLPHGLICSTILISIPPAFSIDPLVFPITQADLPIGFDTERL